MAIRRQKTKTRAGRRGTTRRGAKARGGARTASRKPAAGKADKYVYFFGGGKAEGRAAMRNLLGGKGANLAEMAGLGLPVPPGFTISTDVCTYFSQHGKTYPKELKRRVDAALPEIGRGTGKNFGARAKP